MEEELMSDNDFEIVDSSTIQFATRSRKPKYKHALWEKDDPHSKYLHYKGLQRSYQRRHNVAETPYDHLIDRRMDYETWWRQNSIHLVNIEQIRLEGNSNVAFVSGDMCVCRYCHQKYDGNEAVYNFVCMECMETEEFMEDMDHEY